MRKVILRNLISESVDPSALADKYAYEDSIHRTNICAENISNLASRSFSPPYEIKFESISFKENVSSSPQSLSTDKSSETNDTFQLPGLKQKIKKLTKRTMKQSSNKEIELRRTPPMITNVLSKGARASQVETATVLKTSSKTPEIVPLSWESIVKDFFLEFETIYATSKKAHFDSLPIVWSNDEKVVDGARTKWCYPLLLDALAFLLTNDKFDNTSRRTFNQTKVLFDCIWNELDRCFSMQSGCSEENRALYEEFLVARKEAIAPSEAISSTAANADERHELQMKALLRLRPIAARVLSVIEVQSLASPWQSIREQLLPIMLNEPCSKSQKKYESIVEALAHHESFQDCFQQAIVKAITSVTCGFVNLPAQKEESHVDKRVKRVLQSPKQSPTKRVSASTAAAASSRGRKEKRKMTTKNGGITKRGTKMKRRRVLYESSSESDEDIEASLHDDDDDDDESESERDYGARDKEGGSMYSTRFGRACSKVSSLRPPSSFYYTPVRASGARKSLNSLQATSAFETPQSKRKLKESSSSTLSKTKVVDDKKIARFGHGKNNNSARVPVNDSEGFTECDDDASPLMVFDPLLAWQGANDDFLNDDDDDMFLFSNQEIEEEEEERAKSCQSRFDCGAATETNDCQSDVGSPVSSLASAMRTSCDFVSIAASERPHCTSFRPHFDYLLWSELDQRHLPITPPAHRAPEESNNSSSSYYAMSSRNNSSSDSYCDTPPFIAGHPIFAIENSASLDLLKSRTCWDNLEDVFVHELMDYCSNFVDV